MRQTGGPIWEFSDNRFGGFILDLDLFLETMRVLGIVIGVGVQLLDCYDLFIGPI